MTEELNARGLIGSALYWSDGGEVACGDHTPAKGSDTWRRDRWRRMARSSATRFAAIARCEYCQRGR